MNTAESSYIPGTCNINTAEVAYRKKAAIVGAIITVVLTIVFLVLPISSVFRAILFLPAFVAAIGYLQTKNKFCVAYGASGMQNADEDSDKALAVALEEARVKDKKKARTMNTQAALAALVFTLVIGLLP